MKDARLEKIREELLLECEDDWVALWWILAKLRRAYGENYDKDKTRALALDLISELLKTGKVEAGWPTADGGWDSWKLSPDAVLTRIEADWDASDKEPAIGNEIVWLTTASPAAS